MSKGETGTRGGRGREHQAQNLAGGGRKVAVEPGAEAKRGVRQELADTGGVRGAEGGGQAAQDSGGGIRPCEDRFAAAAAAGVS